MKQRKLSVWEHPRAEGYKLVQSDGRFFVTAPDGAALGEFVAGEFRQTPRWLPDFDQFYVIDRWEEQIIHEFEQVIKTSRRDDATEYTTAR